MAETTALGEDKRISRRRLLKRLALFGLPAITAGTWETDRLTVTRHSIAFPSLDPSAQPLRIVQISDLHRGPLVRAGMVARTVEAVNSERPDIVLMTGDFVSYDAEYMHDCGPTLSRIQA